MTEGDHTMSQRPSMTLIAALSPSNGLGLNGGLPWSLKKEMAYFRRATMYVPEAEQQKGARNAVVMGRNTWESIPPKFRPLKGRINVVVSRTTGADRARELGVDESRDSYLVSSLEEAVAKLSSLSTQVARTFLIGGSQLYTQALRTDDESRGKVTRLLITRILSPQFDCDVFLPEFRTPEQISADAQTSPGIATENISSLASPKALPGQEPLPNAKWRKQSSSELGSFLGPEGVEAGVNSEGVVSYEFQMWEPAQI